MNKKGMIGALTAVFLLSIVSDTSAIFGSKRRAARKEKENCVGEQCYDRKDYNPSGSYKGEVPDAYFDEFARTGGAPGALGAQPGGATMLAIVKEDPETALDRALLRKLQTEREAVRAEADLETAIVGRERVSQTQRIVARQQLELAEKALADQRTDVEAMEAAAPPDPPPPETTIEAPSRD